MGKPCRSLDFDDGRRFLSRIYLTVISEDVRNLSLPFSTLSSRASTILDWVNLLKICSTFCIIDNTHDRKMHEKCNPFHVRFTRTVRFMPGKIEITSCCWCIQNLKILLKTSSFARETVLIFLAFFDVGCCR